MRHGIAARLTRNLGNSARIIAVFLLIQCFPFFCPAAGAAFPSAWTRSCPITVDHTKVAGNLVNFPVLVSYNATTNNETNLPDEMMQTGNPNAAQADGGDIRFTIDAAGTEPLHYEIVTFTQNATLASAKAVIWVALPELSSTVDKTFYVWYKPSSVQTTPVASDINWGSQRVWDQSYLGVWHMNETLTGAGQVVADSTRNALNAASVGVWIAGNQVPGKFGGSLSFINGGSRYVQASNVPAAQERSCEFWFNPNDLTSSQYLFYGGWPNFEFYRNDFWGVGPINWLENYYYTPASYASMLTGANFSTGTWYHMVFTTAANGAYKFFVNGAVSASGTQANFIAWYALQASVAWGTAYDGLMQEARISTTARSAAWIATEYNNENAPQTFLTRGTAAAAGRPATSPIATISGVQSLRI